jgi:alkylation response protein AidB-like acyl-CoA dehydrogenase
MDVRLSPEQQALRDAAAQVVDRLGPKAVGQLDDEDRIAKLDAAVDASGWRELRTATEDGPPWASGVEVCIVAEQLGRGLADAAFVGPTLAAELRRLAGMPAATGPETVLLVADLGGLGADVAVDAAGAAAGLTVERGTLVRVPLGGATVDVDLTRPAAAPAGEPEVLGPIGDADVARVAALGLAIAVADLVGTMQGAVDLGAGYVAERRQYGQPVGAFQAVQHLLADALVATEGSRSAALHAAWAVDALEPAEALAAGAVAKAYAGRAARTVCETVIQVHGGIGNTWECLAHVHLRRALLSTELFGGVEASLARVLEHAGIG